MRPSILKLLTTVSSKLSKGVWYISREPTYHKIFPIGVVSIDSNTKCICLLEAQLTWIVRSTQHFHLVQRFTCVVQPSISETLASLQSKELGFSKRCMYNKSLPLLWWGSVPFTSKNWWNPQQIVNKERSTVMTAIFTALFSPQNMIGKSHFLVIHLQAVPLRTKYTHIYIHIHMHD